MAESVRRTARLPGKRSAAWRAAEAVAREEWGTFQRGSVMSNLIPDWREIAPVARERMILRVLGGEPAPRG